MVVSPVLPEPPLQEGPRVLVGFFERKKIARETIRAIYAYDPIDIELDMTPIAISRA